MSQSNDIFKLLHGLSHDPKYISTDLLKNSDRLSVDQLNTIKKLGISFDDLQKDLQTNLSINYDRYHLYFEFLRALDHWMIGPSIELFADASTKYNPVHGSSVWITSENSKYADELNDFLDYIGIEEKIFDWAYSTGAFGDLFVQPLGKPGVGVYAVMDDLNPLEISRLDHKGHLIGFYKTPLAASNSQESRKPVEQQLMPPWDYVHFRLLGVKKLRPLEGDPLHSSQRSTFLTATDSKQLTSKYGTSLIINALAPYKRLRMAEDSLLLARLTRGMIRYVYKLAVSGTSLDANASLIDMYSQALKRARAFDSSSSSNAFYNERPNMLNAMSDLFLPVWGQVGDLDFMKIGEADDVNIKWIVDIKELRKQVSTALRVPLPLLGSFTEEASGALGSQSIEKLDIGFSRNSKRLQRSLIVGITRLCQIHLAYKGLDPDPSLFSVHMNESSGAEENEILTNIGKSMGIIRSFMKTIKGINKNVNEEDLFDYCNQKFLKLEDFKLKDFLNTIVNVQTEKEPEKEEKKVPINNRKIVRENLDLVAYLPINEDVSSKLSKRDEKIWESLYKEQKIKTKVVDINEICGVRKKKERKKD